MTLTRNHRSASLVLTPSGSGPAIAELAPAEALGPVDTSREPWPGEEIAVGKARIFRRSTPSPNPDAEPALYVHGLGGASTNFTDLADLLSPYLAGEALDLPGFGRSGPSPERDYSILGHSRLVIRYLEQSGRGPVHLVGNSMGGAISIQVAATRPDLVRTLTLVSPAVPDVRPRKRADLLLPLLLLPGVGQRAVARVEGFPPEQRARAVIELCFAHPEKVPPHRLAEAAEEIAYRRDLSWANEAFLRSFRGIARSYLTPGARSAWRVMRQIQARTLVVWGDRDQLVDVSNAPRVAASIPDARLLVLTDVGHTAQLEDPVSTARAMLKLLDTRS
ncbi:MAG TPA: alpha/beta hydrolase [Jatrophihabitans sp.]|nr:alpha/beta hydrolase [Jatrophihabitans sp.]